MNRWLISAAIGLIFVLSLFSVNRMGVSSRYYGKAYAISEAGVPLYFVSTPSRVYDLWKAKGSKGRVIVHMSRFFNFMPVDYEQIPVDLNRFPPAYLPSAYKGMLDGKNFMWVAARDNLVREIYNIVPSEMFGNKLRQLKEMDDRPAVESYSETGIVVTHFGLRRTITPLLPNLTEPVLLVVDASYFLSSDEAEIARTLQASGLRTDLIAMSLSEGSSDITDAERQRLKKFALLIGKPQIFETESGSVQAR